jgi:hypothetical protein
MSSRREKLISSALGKSQTAQAEQSLDTVVKLVLGDMGQFYSEFHVADGPGVIVMQPESKEASMFYMPIAALHDWREDYPDGAKEIQRIIEACVKINPLEQAAYLIVDKDGFRFSIVDYNKTSETESISTV